MLVSRSGEAAASRGSRDKPKMPLMMEVAGQRVNTSTYRGNLTMEEGSLMRTQLGVSCVV